jgi:hypothetical protein
MEDVTLAHAKEHLEELIERAARVEEVRISDPKVGTVKLTPVHQPDVLAPCITDHRCSRPRSRPDGLAAPRPVRPFARGPSR